MRTENGKTCKIQWVNDSILLWKSNGPGAKGLGSWANHTYKKGNITESATLESQKHLLEPPPDIEAHFNFWITEVGGFPLRPFSFGGLFLTCKILKPYPMLTPMRKTSSVAISCLPNMVFRSLNT